MKKNILLIIFIIAVFYQWSITKDSSTDFIENQVQTSSDNKTENIVERAYKNRRSDVQITGSGIVIKLLRDDNKGSRHQKFLLRLLSGHTLLIAHNIDLAPRINTISNGDQVDFYGEYEWNNKGGVIHWTHHDPNGKHIDGWLKHKGKTYQ